jgi:hypothetical protein
MNRFCTNNLAKIILAVFLTISFQNIYSQSRIHYANKDIFLSGTNIAWINFANDIGPGAPNIAAFNEVFRAVRQNGGNSLRLWLHTNGTATPVFDANGKVSGPGTNTLQYLKQILDLAYLNHVGIQLCLWSFDMLSTTEGIGTAQMTANTNLLTDTAYTNAYIRNCLIPMVNAVKGNPALLSWEVFNEPEGMSNIGNYSGVNSVNISYIQRVCNLVAGAIHRTDSTAIVTNGAGSLRFNSDITLPSKVSAANSINAMSQSERQKITDEFNSIHRTSFSVDGYIAYLLKLAATPNFNYYRDDRLIAAGGDSMGILDFYNTHFYANGSSDQVTSPLNHSYSVWGLTKPLVIAEFYDQETFGVLPLDIFNTLYSGGYAGAMSWSWTQGSGIPIKVIRTWPLQNMMSMFTRHQAEVQIFPITGSIYSFSVDTTTIQKGDNTILRWNAQTGSTVTLNGVSVSAQDSLTISPPVTTTYTLHAAGAVDSTLALTVNVLPTGRIINFAAVPPTIGKGEYTTLVWQVVKNSIVKLNGKPEKVQDTLVVYPDSVINTYNLVTSGDEKDSLTITVEILPADQVDRALGCVLSTSSNDTVSNPFSKPENLVDGNYFSAWQASKKSGEWIQLDLGRIITLNQVIIYWSSAGYAKQYSLQASDDLVTWKDLASSFNATGGTANVETLSNLQGEGRYIYLLLQSAGQNAFSIREIEVYGVLKTTSVKADESKIPTKYSLYQNYPNPFNPATNIQFDLPKAGEASIIIYNILGQKVAEPLHQQMSAGSYTVRFDASRLSSGIYFYTLKSGSFITTNKMLLLK